MPFNSAEYLQSPVDPTSSQADDMWGPSDGGWPGPQASDIAGPRAHVDPDWPPNPGGTVPWPPQWDAPPPEMHPDHPSAPVPRVRVLPTPPQRPSPGGSAAGGNAPARYRQGRPDRPGQGYRTGPVFGTGPGPGAGPAEGPAYKSGQYQARLPAQALPSPAAEGFGPAQDYTTGHGYPPARDNRNGRANPPAQRGDSRQGYPPVQGYHGGQSYLPDPRLQPDTGYLSADGYYGPGQGYPPAPGRHGGPGNGRLYAVPDSLAAGAEGMSLGSGQMVQFGGQAAGLAEPAWQGDPQDSGSFALAEQLLSNADSQAAAITQDAWSQATAIREAAEQDAAAVRHQASTIRDAAEKEVAEMRAAILSMSEQLGRLAAYVTENFAIPGGAPTALRAGGPAALVAAPPAAPAQPATRPARPATRPPGPATLPGKSVTRQPATGTRGRQVRAARKMVALLAVMVTLGVASGATELALHGVPFFIFRANGAGASETGPVENQGPGQPDAPGAHHAHQAPPAHQNK
jgi:hypothetical protein